MPRPLALVAAFGLILASGCNRQTPDAVDDEALQAIDEAVATQLNEPPQAIVKLLQDLDRPSPIGLDSLQIPVDQKSAPIDWWLLRHGLVDPIIPPPSPEHPTFLVSQKGSQLAGQGPVWFSAAAGEPSKVDCHSPEVTAAGGCEVELTVSPQLTPAAAGLSAGGPLEAIKLQAVVASSADGWQVRELHTNGPSLHDYALNALLGSDAERTTARQQVLSSLAIGGSTATPAQAQFTPTTVQSSPNIPPVAPVIGDNPYALKRRP